MSFSIDLCNFAVRRDKKTYKVSGVELSTKLQSGDVLLLQRGDTQYKYTIDNLADLSGILDTDIFVCTDVVDDTTYKVTGDVFKSLIDVDIDEIVEQCITEALLFFKQCIGGCDSEFCKERCVELFIGKLQDCQALIPDNSN